jgi:hypothetical protein
MGREMDHGITPGSFRAYPVLVGTADPRRPGRSMIRFRLYVAVSKKDGANDH